MQRLRRAAPKLRLTLGCSTFVPKAHTPFQWYGVSSGERNPVVARGLGRRRRLRCCRRQRGRPASLPRQTPSSLNSACRVSPVLQRERSC